MTETTFPFAGAPVAAPAEEAPPLSNSNRTKMLAVGGLAGALVLAGAGYFLFFAGDGSGGTEATHRTRSSAPVPVTAPTPAPVVQRRINAKSFGRDPFRPFIVEQVAAPAAVAVAPATGTTGSTTSGTTSSTPGSTSGSTAGTTAPVQTPAHNFRVVSVAPDNTTVTVKVDGKQYNNLRAGEVFATYFKVVLITGPTNAFQYGEEKFNVLGTKRLTIA